MERTRYQKGWDDGFKAASKMNEIEIKLLREYQASDKPSNCILCDVSNRNKVRELLIAFIKDDAKKNDMWRIPINEQQVDEFIINL